MKLVAVIGAGPAGSAAAMALARFPAVRVLLLEKERSLLTWALSGA